MPEHGMNPMSSIPTKADWGDYRSDLDQEWAHGKFAGKSNEEMQPYFREIPIEAAGDLRFMPEIPFRYYMLGFRDRVMSGAFETYDSDAASCFLHLVVEKLESKPLPTQLRQLLGVGLSVGQSLQNAQPAGAQ